MEDEDYDAHDFLKATYQNHALSEATRIKAAAAAIRFERPSLSASLNVDLKQVDPAMTARLQKTWERLHGLRAARKAGQVAEYCRGEAPEFDALPMPDREPYPAHLPQDMGSKLDWHIARAKAEGLTAIGPFGTGKPPERRD